jgi:hypothetical protein
MTKKITLQLPESLEQQLIQKAQKFNLSLESLIIEALEQYNSETQEEGSENDPITPLIGTLQMDQNDLAENHDFYLSQGLHQELNRGE